jgi:hypothetical protein
MLVVTVGKKRPVCVDLSTPFMYTLCVPVVDVGVARVIASTKCVQAPVYVYIRVYVNAFFYALKLYYPCVKLNHSISFLIEIHNSERERERIVFFAHLKPQQSKTITDDMFW